MILKYLKDQGGQFWGAFAQSYANAVEKARDRPLKEAMMKAQIGHQNAVTDKLNMDIQQARQHQQALTDLSNVLQPKESTTYTNPTAGLEATNYGETNPPTQEPDYGKTTALKMPNVKSPEVQGALINAQPRESAIQLLKQSMAQDLTNVAFSSWEDAVKGMADPAFQAANPYGGRLEATPKGIMFKGIHPVNPEAATFHRSPEQGGGEKGALNYVEKRGATSAAANVAGKSGQQLNEPIQPVQPMPGRQGNAPLPGTAPMTTAPGESPFNRAKQAGAAAGAQGTEQVKAQKGLLGLAGMKTIVDRLDALSQVIPAGDPGVSRFTTGAQNYLAGLMQSDPNVAEFESKRKAYANIINRSLLAERGVITDRDREYAVDAIPSIWDTTDVRKLKMTQFKAMSDLMVWGEEQLAAGKLDPNVFRQKLDTIQSSLEAANPAKGKAGGQNVINYNGKKYIKQNGALFEVRE